MPKDCMTHGPKACHGKVFEGAQAWLKQTT